MLMRLLRALIVGFIAFALVINVALASWAYLFPITMVDTTNTTRNYYPVIFNFGGQSLIDAGYINASGNNTNMQIGGTSIKYMMDTANVSAVIPILPSGGVATASLYTGYSPEQTNFSMIPGHGGNITTAHASNLNLGDNYTVTVTGLVNTSNGSSKILMDKGTFDIAVSPTVTQNVTATISGIPSQTLRPDGAGDTTNITNVSGAPTHWQAVSDNSDATYVYTAGGAYELDLYTAQNISPNLPVIDSVTYYFRIGTSGGGSAFAYPVFKIGGTIYNGTAQNSAAADTKNEVYLTSPATGLAWTQSEINNLQMGIGLENTGGAANSRVYDVWLVIAPGNVTLTATGVTSANTVSVTSNSTSWALLIDGVQADNGTSTTVPNSSSQIDWMDGNSMPYADSLSISINGTQQLYYAPNTIVSGTTIPDRASDATNNPGTIHLGSNSGLNITYGEMTSFESTMAEVSPVGGFSVPNATMPNTWFASGENASSLPFYDAFSSAAAQTGTPVQSYYFMAIIGFAFGAFLVIVIFTRSALLAYVAMVIVFAVGSSMTIVPAWIVFVLIITGGGIMYLYRQVSY